MIELFNQESAVKEYGDEMEEKGYKEGYKEGLEEVVRMYAKLFELGKPEELGKALEDPEYMNKLLKEYGLAED